MANLAVAFHWSPTDCYALDLDELIAWEERARQRTQSE
ncbi:GpE family phage tail protein [Acinetobacter sp. B5B]|nr:GpE family phage tail protein [Acinetobacter baretiae]